MSNKTAILFLLCYREKKKLAFNEVSKRANWPGYLTSLRPALSASCTNIIYLGATLIGHVLQRGMKTVRLGTNSCKLTYVIWKKSRYILKMLAYKEWYPGLKLEKLIYE